MQDLILFDKPKGITSFDVIRILRRELGVRSMGHAGTLDPLATGLLIIGVGPGTKKLTALIGLSKTYEAEILLGVRTESGDVDGKVLETKPVPELSDAQIEAAIKSLIGTHDLAVPIFSALKRGGKPLYEYAREGKPVEVPVRAMTVLDAKYLGREGDVIKTWFNVKSGVYVRSLAEELGRRLDTFGTIQNLRRTSVGEYKVEDARTVKP